MAVNTLGQTLQLLPVAAPGNDLTLGLQPGDILQGRLVDILPDNRAIIQIKGFNLLAQLPEAQNGQQFSKGQILDLAVLQAQPNSNSSNSSGTSASAQAATPALTLKLTGISSSIVSGSQASALNQEAPLGSS
jgi:ribosomal protein S1